jgi:hypothetical protein
MKENRTTIIIFIIILILTVGVVFMMMKASAKKMAKLAAMTPREIASTCTTDMATQFHIHPELHIVIDGVPVIVPADIGITDTCMHPLHTHDDTGTLHVESPVQKDFTLGDFFFVWDQPFDSMHILDKVATKPSQITMTVNGVPVDTFENTILVDKDQLVITYTSK